MSIGVEHMFVICNAIDQTSLARSANLRVHQALSHAGPAITTTSATTAFAFAFGMLSSLDALRSFCLFATVNTMMLWASNMTLFLAVVVWDTRRVGQRRKECFGACFCELDSLFCCAGRLASKRQKEFCS